MHNYILVLSKHNKTACKTYVFQKTAFHTTKGYLLLYKKVAYWTPKGNLS